MKFVIGILAVLALASLLTAWRCASNMIDGDPLGNWFSRFFHMLLTLIAWGSLSLLMILTVSRFHSLGQVSGRSICIIAGCFVIAAIFSWLALMRLHDKQIVGVERNVLLLTSLLLPSVLIATALCLDWPFKVPLNWLIAFMVTCVALLGSAQSLIRFEPEREITTADIQLPAILIHDRQSCEIIARPEELQTMHSNRYVHREQEPILVDSSFAIYTLERLRSRRHDLWLLITGPGQIEVVFTLKAWPDSSPADAKKLIGACKYFRGNNLPKSFSEQTVSADSMRSIIELLYQKSTDPAQ